MSNNKPARIGPTIRPKLITPLEIPMVIPCSKVVTREVRAVTAGFIKDVASANTAIAHINGINELAAVIKMKPIAVAIKVS